MHRAYNNIQA